MRPSPGVRAVRRFMPLALAGATAVTGIVAAAWLWRAPAPAEPSRRALVRLTSDVGWTDYPAISPDGRLVAYARIAAAKVTSISGFSRFRTASPSA